MGEFADFYELPYVKKYSTLYLLNGDISTNHALIPFSLSLIGQSHLFKIESVE